MMACVSGEGPCPKKEHGEKCHSNRSHVHCAIILSSFLNQKVGAFFFLNAGLVFVIVRRERGIIKRLEIFY